MSAHENVFNLDAPPMPDGYIDSIADHYESQPVEDDEDRARLLTDYGNACRLIDAFGHDLRRCPSLPGAGWLVWDGRRWRVDDSDRVVRLAARVAVLIQRDAEAEYAKLEGMSEEDPEHGRIKKRAERMAAWAMRSESRSGIRACLDLAQSDPRVLVDKATLDGDRWLLNVQNGTIDLKSGQLRTHSRNDMITKLAPVNYDQDASSALWDSFLLRIMEGRQEMVNFLRRMVGYSLAGTIREQVFAVCWGGGSNGKGTFIGTIREALGEYATTTNPETFMAKREGSIPNDLAALDGPRLVIASETKENKPLDEQAVKSITCGDRESMSARFMRGEWFEFKPQLTAWLLTNHKPTIKGTDQGIWRRIRLVPFLHDFEADPEKDPDFGERLIATELEGVLAWAVRGCLEWQAGGLQEPEGVIEATKEYRDEMDVIADFLEEECMHGPAAEVDNSALYKAYKEWCKENGEYIRTHRWLTGQLKRRGYEQVQRKSKVWIGFCIRPTPIASTYRGGGW